MPAICQSWATDRTNVAIVEVITTAIVASAKDTTAGRAIRSHALKSVVNNRSGMARTTVASVNVVARSVSMVNMFPRAIPNR